jgi:hypothetical protein
MAFRWLERTRSLGRDVMNGHNSTPTPPTTVPARKTYSTALFMKRPAKPPTRRKAHLCRRTVW